MLPWYYYFNTKANTPLYTSKSFRIAIGIKTNHKTRGLTPEKCFCLFLDLKFTKIVLKLKKKYYQNYDVIATKALKV